MLDRKQKGLSAQILRREAFADAKPALLWVDHFPESSQFVAREVELSDSRRTVGRRTFDDPSLPAGCGPLKLLIHGSGRDLRSIASANGTVWHSTCIPTARTLNGSRQPNRYANVR